MEDELADAVIRLLDYAGLKDLDVEKYIKACCDDEEDDESVNKGNKSFVEKVYDVVSMFLMDEYIEFTILDIIDLAEFYNIDLMWFIREKMEYNKQRAYLHGKDY